MWKDFWFHLQEPKANLTVFHVPAHKALTPPDNLEAEVLATDPAVDTTDWMHRKSGHSSDPVEWHITRDVGLPWKYTDLVNVVTSCPVCSKQHLEQLSKESEAYHWSS